MDIRDSCESHIPCKFNVNFEKWVKKEGQKNHLSLIKLEDTQHPRAKITWQDTHLEDTEFVFEKG